MNYDLIRQHADDLDVQVQFDCGEEVLVQIFMPNGVTRSQSFAAGTQARTVTEWIDHDVTRFWKGEPKKAAAKKGAK
jgi:hypothetical protein